MTQNWGSLKNRKKTYEHVLTTFPRKRFRHKSNLKVNLHTNRTLRSNPHPGLKCPRNLRQSFSHHYQLDINLFPRRFLPWSFHHHISACWSQSHWVQIVNQATNHKWVQTAFTTGILSEKLNRQLWNLLKTNQRLTQRSKGNCCRKFKCWRNNGTARWW